MPPRKNVVQSEDEDAQDSPPPLIDHSDSEDVTGDEEDETTSVDGFIDDRALEELTEKSDSAEEGFDDHVANTRDKTPPSRSREPAKFPLDPDDEGVEEAEGFQADLVESPKKPKRVLKKVSSDSQSDDEGNQSAMDVSPAPVMGSKRRGVKGRGASNRNDSDVQESDDNAMEVSPIRKKEPKSVVAKKTAVGRKPVIKKEEVSDEELPTVKQSNRKKPVIKKEEVSDEEVPTVKLSNRKAATSKAEVIVVGETDSEEVTITGYKKAPAKKAANKATPKKTAPVKKPARKKAISPETISDSEDDRAAALKLRKDDDMYPESKSAKVVAGNLKRGLPITPPLATRASSKKQKLDVESADAGTIRPLSYAEAVSSPPRKPAVPARKANARPADDHDDAETTDSAATQKTPAAKKPNVAVKVDSSVTPKPAATKNTKPTANDKQASASKVASPRKSTAAKKPKAELHDDPDVMDDNATRSTKDTSSKVQSPKKPGVTKNAKAVVDDDEVDADNNAAPEPPFTQKKSSKVDSPKKPAVTKKGKAVHEDDQVEADDNATPDPPSPRKRSSKVESTQKPAVTKKTKAVDEDDDVEVDATPEPPSTPKKSSKVQSTKKPVVTKKVKAVDEDKDVEADDNATPEPPSTPKRSSKDQSTKKPGVTKKAKAVVSDADESGSNTVKKAGARRSKGDNDDGASSSKPASKKAKAPVRKSVSVNSDDDDAPVDNEEDDDQNREVSYEPPDLATDPAFQAALNSPAKKVAKVEDDVFEAAAGSSNWGSPSQKYTDRIWKPLPPVRSCQIYDPGLLDPYLSKNKSYLKLSKLRRFQLSNLPGKANGNDQDPGTIFLGMWNTLIPKETFSALVKLVSMSRQGRYIHPSRAPLDELYARKMADNRHELAIDDQTAISVSIVNVRESGLKRTMGENFLYHGVRGIPLTYEAQREPAVWGEITRRSTLYTPFYNSVLNYATKYVPNNDRNRTPKRKGVDLKAEFFNRYRSPQKGKPVDGGMLNDHVGGLEFDDNIPVYDARYLDPDFEFTEDVFMNPSTYFSLLDWSEYDEYKGEIPDNSLCVLGYTTQFYNYRDDNKAKESGDDPTDRKGKRKADDSDDVEPAKLRVNLFLQWIFVVGVIN